MMKLSMFLPVLPVVLTMALAPVAGGCSVTSVAASQTETENMSMESAEGVYRENVDGVDFSDTVPAPGRGGELHREGASMGVVPAKVQTLGQAVEAAGPVATGVSNRVPVPDTVSPVPLADRSAVIREIDDAVYDFLFEANFDSLLNIYYINRSLEAVIDDEAFETADTLLPDFPDSVYIARLSDIPSVIDLSYNRLVKNYINVYTIKRRDQVRSMLTISDYYFPMFEQVFDLYGVPYELKYLAVIESALNPRAVSRAGAVGMWQFMHGTARAYGLRINSLVDERRDPLAATHAAAKYLGSLHRIYGDWTLALAAYNCGPGNVNKAIRRAGGKRDFWEIYYHLPRETRGYVPAFIAATYAMTYHREHLLQRVPVEIELHTDTVVIGRKLHLMQVSEVLGIPVQQLRDLNPQYRYDIIPATPKELYSLALPLSKTGAFIDLQDSIIAFKDSLYLLNDRLLASPVDRSSLRPADLPADKYDKLLYTVKPGDNLGYIADWYDVRLSDLRYWNNVSRDVIRSGQSLVIYKPKGNGDRYKEVNNMTFTQKQVFAGRAVSGTSAASASVQGGAGTVSASSATGDQAGGGLGTAGGALGAAGAGQAGAASAVAGGAASGDDGEFITYTVQRGDTLWDIAKKFPGVTDTDISRWNNLSNSHRIQPGQKIRIRKI